MLFDSNDREVQHVGLSFEGNGRDRLFLLGFEGRGFEMMELKIW